MQQRVQRFGQRRGERVSRAIVLGQRHAIGLDPHDLEHGARHALDREPRLQHAAGVGRPSAIQRRQCSAMALDLVKHAALDSAE